MCKPIEAEYIEFIIREMLSSFSMEQKRRITLSTMRLAAKEASCKQGFILALATRANNIKYALLFAVGQIPTAVADQGFRTLIISAANICISHCAR
jgi:hypothetical protein